MIIPTTRPEYVSPLRLALIIKDLMGSNQFLRKRLEAEQERADTLAKRVGSLGLSFAPLSPGEAMLHKAQAEAEAYKELATKLAGEIELEKARQRNADLLRLQRRRRKTR